MLRNIRHISLVARLTRKWTEAWLRRSSYVRYCENPILFVLADYHVICGHVESCAMQILLILNACKLLFTFYHTQ